MPQVKRCQGGRLTHLDGTGRQDVTQVKGRVAGPSGLLTAASFAPVRQMSREAATCGDNAIMCVHLRNHAHTLNISKTTQSQRSNSGIPDCSSMTELLTS